MQSSREFVHNADYVNATANAVRSTWRRRFNRANPDGIGRKHSHLLYAIGNKPSRRAPYKMGSMTSNNKICRHCIREPFLQREVSARGSSSDCSFCCRRARAYDLALLAARVDAVFEQYYRRTPTAPTHQERASMHASRLEWRRRGLPVVDAIAQAAGIPRDAAVDIQCLLEARHDDADARRTGLETEFCSDAHYEERASDGSRWRERWMQFERAMKTEARFFGHHAKEVLTQVFAGIDDIDDISGGLHPLVAGIGPDAHVKSLYRARVFQSENSLRDALSRPDLELGPPPTAIASAGRMNARGISVFYGATHAEDRHRGSASAGREPRCRRSIRDSSSPTRA